MPVIYMVALQLANYAPIEGGKSTDQAFRSATRKVGSNGTAFLALRSATRKFGSNGTGKP